MLLSARAGLYLILTLYCLSPISAVRLAAGITPSMGLSTEIDTGEQRAVDVIYKRHAVVQVSAILVVCTAS